MEGIRFVREDHYVLADGCYLPTADLLGFIQNSLHDVVFKHPELKNYVPLLLEVDIFTSWDGDKFLLFISPEKRGHLPARGSESKYLPSLRESGEDMLGAISGYLDITNFPKTKASFEQLKFAQGFAAAGVFPLAYTEDAKVAKATAGKEVAKLIQHWAQARRQAVENSRIFLSHKGVNKPLVDKIDQALRLLNLQTWFDRDDMVAGDTLVRAVDSAFGGCSAAVFFITKDYIDSGVIRNEIDRAMHEAAMRKDGFRVIPLVLAQHGGSDAHVPSPFGTLVWKTVDDAEIVPTILKGLPAAVQALICYAPLK